MHELKLKPLRFTRGSLVTGEGPSDGTYFVKIPGGSPAILASVYMNWRG